jgi:hypothetical protein
VVYNGKKIHPVNIKSEKGEMDSDDEVRGPLLTSPLGANFKPRGEVIPRGEVVPWV